MNYQNNPFHPSNNHPQWANQQGQHGYVNQPTGQQVNYGAPQGSRPFGPPSNYGNNVPYTQGGMQPLHQNNVQLPANNFQQQQAFIPKHSAPTFIPGGSFGSDWRGEQQGLATRTYDEEPTGNITAERQKYSISERTYSITDILSSSTPSTGGKAIIVGTDRFRNQAFLVMEESGTGHKFFIFIGEYERSSETIDMYQTKGLHDSKLPLSSPALTERWCILKKVPTAISYTEALDKYTNGHFIRYVDARNSDVDFVIQKHDLNKENYSFTLDEIISGKFYVEQEVTESEYESMEQNYYDQLNHQYHTEKNETDADIGEPYSDQPRE